MMSDKFAKYITDLTLNAGAPDASIKALEAQLGFALPRDYIEFMMRWNGAEGRVGDSSWLRLWPIEEIIEANEGYGADKFHPGMLYFGTDGGGDAFAFDKRIKHMPIVEIPYIGGIEDAWLLGDTFTEFLEYLYMYKYVPPESKDTLLIASESPTSLDAQVLLKGMYDELNVIFADQGGEAGENGTMPPLDFPALDGVFVVAHIDGAAVGCAGIRRFDDQSAEIKRVFVSEMARGRGVARAMMIDLEARARSLGYRRLVLETTTRQPAAMHLYESLGYVRIANYGKYADDPLSRCYAKTLIP